MLYIFMGQSCTGKSTAAEKLKEQTGAEIFSGKDYLRMAKNEDEAWRLFFDKLSEAASGSNASGESVIYLLAEISQLDRIIDLQGARKVKFTASLDTIKSRFAERMHGRLPSPVEMMLTRQYEEWEPVQADILIDTTSDNDIDTILSSIGFQ